MDHHFKQQGKYWGISPSCQSVEAKLESYPNKTRLNTLSNINIHFPRPWPPNEGFQFMGVPSSSIFDGILHEINPPAGGFAMESPVCLSTKPPRRLSVILPKRAGHGCQAWNTAEKIWQPESICWGRPAPPPSAGSLQNRRVTKKSSKFLKMFGVLAPWKLRNFGGSFF